MSLFQVKPSDIIYREEPTDGQSYTLEMDKYYDRAAKLYNAFLTLFPLWKKWISSVMPHIRGDKILEVSFGPGYLLEKCASLYECHGIDFNQAMVELAGKRLERRNLRVRLVQGNVESLPYDNNSFDCLINTMAFTGYPDGRKAMGEMIRVLKPGGRLLLVDFDYPENRNRAGYYIAKFIDRSGDILKDIVSIIEDEKLIYERISIGAFGSVSLFIIENKRADER